MAISTRNDTEMTGIETRMLKNKAVERYDSIITGMNEASYVSRKPGKEGRCFEKLLYANLSSQFLGLPSESCSFFSSPLFSSSSSSLMLSRLPSSCAVGSAFAMTPSISSSIFFPSRLSTSSVWESESLPLGFVFSIISPVLSEPSHFQDFGGIIIVSSDYGGDVIVSSNLLFSFHIRIDFLFGNMLRICKLLENIASSFQLKTVLEFTRPVEDGIENRCSGLFVKCRQFGNTDCSPHKSLSHLDSCHEYQCAHEWKKHTRDVHWLCYHSFESGHHTVGVNSRYSSVSS